MNMDSLGKLTLLNISLNPQVIYALTYDRYLTLHNHPTFLYILLYYKSKGR